AQTSCQDELIDRYLELYGPGTDPAAPLDKQVPQLVRALGLPRGQVEEMILTRSGRLIPKSSVKTPERAPGPEYMMAPTMRAPDSEEPVSVDLPAPRKSPGTVRQALSTFFRNSFGSDMLTAYSAEYAWLSNQMAHATMGFVLAAVWALIVIQHGFASWMVWLPLAVPVLKEVTDFILDAGIRSTHFWTNKRELIADGISDIFFWAFGMLLAISLFGFSSPAWWMLAAVLVVGVPIVYLQLFKIWLPRMRRFDYSGMPFNYTRLVKYRDPEAFLPAASIATIQDYQQFLRQWSDDACRHVVITGGAAADRSGLAVSLGCEFISHGLGVYDTSAVKVLENPRVLDDLGGMPDDYRPGVRCLIIDDLNVHLPIPGRTAKDRQEQRQKVTEMKASLPEANIGEARAADQLERVLNLVDRFEALRGRYQHACTIWVLTGDPTGRRVAEWKAFIEQLLTGQDAKHVLVEIAVQPRPAG
ncbi:MAG TPA: hypothetical protein VKE40_01095, partial [Gemmataceae bacterium]|nr:hypothetical protein [Gemmataceae bacterium]